MVIFVKQYGFRLKEMINKLINRRKCLILVVMLLGLLACSDDDDVIIIDLVNLDEVIEQDPNLSSLNTALQLTGLNEAIRASNDITILAPTNEAFNSFLGTTPIENVPLPVLEELLLNHVLNTRLPSVSITTAGSGYSNTGASGPNNTNLSIYFEYDNNPLTEGVYFNGNALVEDADNFGTNGVLHKVNSVIELPTIATFATSNPELNDLVQALFLADSGNNSTVDWIDTVSDPDAGPLTVFAPTNAAFDDLLLELDPEGGLELGQLDPDVVDGILLLHVAIGNVQSTDLNGLNGTIPTLGGNLDLDVDTLTITDGMGREVAIIATLTDIQGVNGVVHVIDTVIQSAVE